MGLRRECDERSAADFDGDRDIADGGQSPITTDLCLFLSGCQARGDGPSVDGLGDSTDDPVFEFEVTKFSTTTAPVQRDLMEARPSYSSKLRHSMPNNDLKKRRRTLIMASAENQDDDAFKAVVVRRKQCFHLSRIPLDFSEDKMKQFILKKSICQSVSARG